METNLETLPIGEDAPRLVNAVIEVPVGSRNKYEYEPDLGVIMRDRVLPGAVRYPTDYGFVPSTLTDRGDALDIVVAAYDPAFPGCVVRARPIGALHITDSKGEEHPRVKGFCCVGWGFYSDSKIRCLYLARPYASPHPGCGEPSPKPLPTPTAPLPP